MSARELIARLAAWGGPNVDKWVHLAGGIVVGAFVAWLAGDGRAAIIAATVAGAVKELVDSTARERHTVDPWDFAATVAGGLAVWAVWP